MPGCLSLAVGYDSPMSRRFQYSLKTLFTAMLVVASFLGKMLAQKGLDLPLARQRYVMGGGDTQIDFECIEMRDGTKWYKASDGEIIFTNEVIDDGQAVVDHLRLPDGSHWRHVPEKPFSPQ